MKLDLILKQNLFSKNFSIQISHNKILKKQ